MSHPREYKELGRVSRGTERGASFIGFKKMAIISDR